MRRVALALVALVAVACGGGATQPGPTRSAGEVRYRTLTQEGQNANFCVEGPEFAAAATQAGWDEIIERHSACQPGGGRPVIISADFESEIAVVGWWGVRPCLGYAVSTVRVALEAQAVRVEARTIEPQGACAQALGALESFYAVTLADVAGAERLVFVLDGKQVGETPMPPSP